MDALIEHIRNAENLYFLGGASRKDVDFAEQCLGVKFAEDYRDYVSAYGEATFDSRELTGVCMSERLSVVAVTERARQRYPHFPKNAYVVEELMFDDILTIQDCSGTVFSYGPADEAEKIAESLVGYLFPNAECRA